MGRLLHTEEKGNGKQSSVSCMPESRPDNGSKIREIEMLAYGEPNSSRASL